MTKTLIMIGAIAALAIPVAADAQGRGRKTSDIPPGHRPPAGMCRIWIDGVPPGRQPAPTDCTTAIRNRPANARVIYGDDARNDGKRGKKYKSKGVASNQDSDQDSDRKKGRRADRSNQDSDSDQDSDQDSDRRQVRREDRDRSRGSSDAGVYRPSSSDICSDRDRNGTCDDRQGTQRRRTGGVLGPVTDEILRRGGSRTGNTCSDRDRNGICDDRQGN